MSFVQFASEYPYTALCSVVGAWQIGTVLGKLAVKLTATVIRWCFA